MYRYSSRRLLVIGTILFLVVGSVMATSDKECLDSITELETCLPYVGGTAKSPTQDCCAALKRVLKTSMKCLCLVIKDRNNPELGLNINITLAVSLPHLCTTSANFSQCPALLGLYPKSPDAQFFYELGKNSSKLDGISPIAGGPAPRAMENAPLGGGVASPGKNGGCDNTRNEMLFHVTIGLLFTCFLINKFYYYN